MKDWQSLEILENLNVQDMVLLTGAGFTANYGAPLAKKMWSRIASNPEVKKHKRVKQCLLGYKDSFDYESAYNSIMQDDYSKEEKKAMHEAIYDAYDYIDNTLRDFIENNPNGINSGKVREFLDKFFRYKNMKAFCFTLNQDLFNKRILRSYYPLLPDIPQNQECVAHNMNLAFKESDYIPIPSKDDMIKKIENHGIQKLKNEKYFYIKLHGSQDWITHDRKQLMIIGREKMQQIEDKPLLLWFFNIFRKVLSLRGRKLLIIGYGFRDEHINRVIVDAVKNHELKLLVITPNPEKDLFEALDQDVLELGLEWHYFDYLYRMFPENSNMSHDYKDLLENFMGLRFHKR